jgi:hypothetical protein
MRLSGDAAAALSFRQTRTICACYGFDEIRPLHSSTLCDSGPNPRRSNSGSLRFPFLGEVFNFFHSRVPLNEVVQSNYVRSFLPIMLISAEALPVTTGS